VVSVSTKLPSIAKSPAHVSDNVADPSRKLPVKRKWLKLGLAVATLNYLFLFAVLFLLNFDPTLALVVAVIFGVGSGIALTVFVLYLR
jgi:hypothetical protein